MRGVRRIYIYHKVHPRAVNQQGLKEKAPDPVKFLGFRTGFALTCYKVLSKVPGN